MNNLIPNQADPTSPSLPEELGLKESEDPSIQNEVDENNIWSIVEQIRTEEEGTRNTMLRESKQLDAYYHGFQHNFWNDRAKTWQRAEDAYFDPRSKIVPTKLKKTFNYFQGWLDSIIAALSVTVPAVIFFPEDADNPDDVEASKVYTRSAELVRKWNDSINLLTEALYIMCTQHLLAFYNYYDESDEYGTYKTPIMSDVNYTKDVSACLDCGSETEEPDAAGIGFCPTCQDIGPTEKVSVPYTENEKTGEEEHPLEKECLEVYGDINVRIPVNCKKQADIHYLILEKEEDINVLKTKYPWIADKISPTADYSPYEVWARRDAFWTDKLDINVATVRKIWLRACAFHMLSPELYFEYQKRFPNGCKAIFVGNDLASLEPENLDDHWTVAKVPTSKYLHFKPTGRDLIPVQDAKNTVRNLEEETVKHGITEMFADSRVLDFDMYAKSTAAPGMTYPIKARTQDQDISRSFYERKAATLGREVEFYDRNLTEDGQFIGGVYPSIFGGVIQGGSQTGKEYELSRAAALQRLTLKWKVITVVFPKTIKKACDDLFKNMTRDLSFSKKSGSGFINVWVKKESISGRVSRVEADASEEFPVSWAQKQERLFQLIQMKSPALDAAIFDPANISFTASLLGFPEASIPGEQDRQKQLFEIQLLLQSKPVPPPPTPPAGVSFGQPIAPLPPPPPTSSIPPDPFDNHQIHASIARNWLISPEGMAMRNENPEGYQNVTLHWQEHESAAMMQIAQSQNSQVSSETVTEPPPSQLPAE